MSRRLFLEPLEGRSLLATITVTGTGDTIAVDGVVTLREAITSANTNANVNSDIAAAGAYGSDTINFNIPGTGVQTINVASALPTITGPVVIDGYTQPGAAPNTDPNGFNATLLIQLTGPGSASLDGVTIAGGGSTVRGLIFNRFGNGIVVAGSGGHTIEGNLIGTNNSGSAAAPNILSGVQVDSSNNRIGGIAPDKRNIVSGNDGYGILVNGLDGSSATGNFIEGNFIGTTATGTGPLGNQDSGIYLSGASNNVIGGLQPGARNIIAANGIIVEGHMIGSGIEISIANASVVQGNYIGLDVSGTIPLGNVVDGVFIDRASNSLIGGTTPEARNVISANGFSGVGVVEGSANTIQGNYIGTDVTGALALGNMNIGVGLAHTSGNIVGGVTPGAGNRIAFNSGAGAGVDGAPQINQENAILGNSIFANRGLGIDHGPRGVTPNDEGDADTGPNLQNFPVLTAVTNAAGTTTIQGTLHSHANTQFRIEFFVSTVADPSGVGEGETLLGFTNVTTDASGNVAYSFQTPAPAGAVFTATATRLDAGLLPIETSEFSQILVASPATFTSLSTSDNFSFPGQSVTFTATVSTFGAGTPTGTVTFRIDGGEDVIVPVNGAGQAVFTTSTLPLGTHTITADYTADSIDLLNSANSLMQTVNQVATQTILTSSNNKSLPGEPVTFTATISAPEAGIPTGTVIFRIDGGGDIVVPLNDSGQASFTTSNLARGVYNISAIYTSDTIVFRSGGNGLKQGVGLVDLSVTMSASAGTVIAGTNLTYTVTLSNAGPDDAMSVVLLDHIPLNTTFVSAIQTAGPEFNLQTLSGGTTFMASGTKLMAGASATFTLIVKVNAGSLSGAAFSNTAEVFPFMADSDLTNNSDTETTSFITQADLSVTKTFAPDLVEPGENLTYTIVLANNGVSDAQEVTLSDAIPAGTTFVSFTAPAGFATTTPTVGGAGTITATSPTLAAGGSATFMLVVRVASATPSGTIVSNTATVTSTTSDPNPANNSDMETSEVQAVLPDCDVTTLNLPGNSGTATLRNDADNPGTGALIVTGTSGNDVIVIEPRPTNTLQIRVMRNGQQIGVFSRSAVQHIVAFGRAGDDTISVSASLSQPATFFGQQGNDVLLGGASADGLSGGVGNDRLYGGGGNDMMCGGDGNDFLYGQAGNDFVGGDAGNDQLFGDAGRDLLLGGAGSDSLRGGTGNDRLFGQAGYDWLYGDEGHDIAVGGEGNDQVRGGSGRDLLIGGLGIDTLFGEADDDILVGGVTVHDNDQAALKAILAEWASTSSYNTRVNRLRSGGGANGVYVLNGTTVSDDAVIDTLWGDGGLDWFLFSTSDKLNDRAAGERLN